jgi:hypothetical protein
MARPVPVIASVSDITTLPTATVLLDGSGSIPSGGATTITGYQWILVDKPVGSAASLTDATTATPTLNDVDTVGNYIVFLIVTDDAGRSSFGTPYAVQHLPPEDLVTFDVPLYAFESPVAGAFRVVKAPYASGAARLNQSLYKTARGEYGWLDQLWNAVDTLEDVRDEVLEVYDRPNKKLLADAVGPQTPAAGVTVDGLNVKDTGAITTLDSNRPTIRSLDDFSVAAGKTLRVEAGGTARFDDIASTSGGDIDSTSAIAAPEVKTPLVTSATTLDITASNGSLTLESTVADVVITAPGADVLVTSDGVFDVTVPTEVNLETTVGSIVLDSADDVTVTAGGEITLTPTTYTETLKPLFAPGHVYGVSADIPTIPDTGVEATFVTRTVSKHEVGSTVLIECAAQYVIGASDPTLHQCDIYVKVQSAGAAAAYVPVVSVGAAKSGGKVWLRATVPMSPSAGGIAYSVVEKDGASPATTVDEFQALSVLDITNDLEVSLVVVPTSGDTWNFECALRGAFSVRLVNPTAEDVI